METTTRFANGQPFMVMQDVVQLHTTAERPR
jgi:hypothetical protein